MDALSILANLAADEVNQMESMEKSGVYDMQDEVKAPRGITIFAAHMNRILIGENHRVSCHRCGNIRKKKLCCPREDCPHIFCGR